VARKFKQPTALNGCVSLHAYNTAQTNASMDSEIFIYWFHSTFVPAVKDDIKIKENLWIQSPKEEECICFNSSKKGQ
jgi:hypothetical protein